MAARVVRAPTAEDRARHDWYATACPCGLPPGDCVEHKRARPSQRPPDGDWRVWLYLGGRGTGKSRTGAGYLVDLVRRGIVKAPLLVAPTAADCRDIVAAAIMEASPPWAMPKHYPSRRAIVFPNGVEAKLLSAEDPEQARGWNGDFLWADELGAWSRARDMWRNLALAIRKGIAKTFVSTTPRRIPTLVDLIAAPTTRVVSESTLANRRHLSPEFIAHLTTMHPPGSVFAEAEIEGRMVDRLESAWFSRFREDLHVSPSAVFDPGKPVIISIDAGTSRTTAATFFQVTKIDAVRMRFTVFASYLAVDRFSGENAEAIRDRFMTDCPMGQLGGVWIDPAASQRTSVGPVALEEYRRVFGDRFVNPSPQGPVTDSLDMVTGLLDRQDIVINPGCRDLIDAFKNYARQERRGEYLDIPKTSQSPYEDSIDALRYGVRGTWPEGRKLPPKLGRVSASLIK